MNEAELRELDAWIAENLFGWAWFERVNREGIDIVFRKALFPPDDEKHIRWNLIGFAPAKEETQRFSDWDKCGSARGENGFSKEPRGVPYYTTDPAAAMEVLHECWKKDRNATAEFIRNNEPTPLSIAKFAKALFGGKQNE